MNSIDWIVLTVTLFSIVFYGIWKSRNMKTIDSYLLADKQLPWYHVGLSVMATQASAITFLSAPGQGYGDGLRFVQFYFGLPLAMVVLCITFIPIFHNLKVFTAYEYLEKRFDQKTRLLTAGLFLLQRGLSTGITIYAPAIILSTLLNVDITYTILLNGLLVILYTVYGGTKAVSYTQMFQMIIIFSGLIIAAVLVVKLLPDEVGFTDALNIAGKMDKMNAIDTKLDWNNRYNLWSGIIGGFFLQLSYFGTDQSQVGRYLTGKSITQSRLGLIMNALIKIPMQFFILLIGVLVFVFYQFHQSPIYFNQQEVLSLSNSKHHVEANELQSNYHALSDRKAKLAIDYVKAKHQNDIVNTELLGEELKDVNQKQNEVKDQYKKLIVQNNPLSDANDTNYIFLSFVTKHFPVGLVGLIVAVIFLASMGSTASGLNSLASTYVIDFYKKFRKKDVSDAREVFVSRWATFFWGLFCILVALYAGKLGNLIEAVNILGSLFYGTILGVFIVAFYIKKVNGTAVFYAALIAECFVIVAWVTDFSAFLWLNVIGCLLVVFFSILIQIYLSFRLKDN
jgi:solute:Na+ symporter, SSS family